PSDAWYPDALLPSQKFDLPVGETQSVWFDIMVDTSVEPDVYEGKVTVCPSGLPEQVVTIRLKVHQFALPNAAPTRTAFGLEAGKLSQWYDVAPETPEFEALYGRYYWFLVDHLITPQYLPSPTDPECLDRYLKDPRVSGVCIPYSADPVVLERNIRLYRDHGWLDRGFLYPVDEPFQRDEYDRFLDSARMIHDIEPKAKIMCPYYKNPVFAPETTAIEHLIGTVDIWCALTSYFHEDALAERKAAGDEIWWYTCCVPLEPYPNFQIQMPPLDHRILFWLQRYYGVQGFLYWSVNTWTDTPYTTLPAMWLDSRQCDSYSDGLLLYPGSDGPVSSIRLELIREGLEDMHYFNLMENFMGRDEVHRFLRQAVGGPTCYERDSRRLMSLRSQLAQRINDFEEST
ncbi:MAG: DUF4091 domain-containing protein, partial [Candidatus Latescibacteria bacterium]|nr:DUF4091 domain-containing protein [Candidatus Latescibacterota bacterium]